MIDIELIRTQADMVKLNLARRGVEPSEIDRLKLLDDQWRAVKQTTDQLRAQQNEISEHIAQAADEERDVYIEQAKELAGRLKTQVEELRGIEDERMQLWKSLPNLAAEDAPDGGENDFVEVAHSETQPQDRKGMTHYLDLVGDMVDIERASKVSGSRFVYLRGALVRLEFALIQYAMDTAEQMGFIPIVPPVLVREEAMEGMGYLDEGRDEVYQTQDDLYLVGTSEQSLGAMHMNEVLESDSLPLRYVGFSTCFRREAGSHGKDVKGMLRVHQFDKVELFSITHPDQSAAEHDLILQLQRTLMDGLGLPYRVIAIAAGDLGNSAAKKYDIETWLPGEQAYRETSSTSNTTDYQARRLNIRTRADGTQFVHMLNGTAFAIGRMLIAILENYQEENGTIVVPEVLRPYLHFTEIKKSAE